MPALRNYETIIAIMHDDVIKWKPFPRYWPFVRGPGTGDLRRYLAHYDVIVMMHDIGKSVLIMNYDCT